MDKRGKIKLILAVISIGLVISIILLAFFALSVVIDDVDSYASIKNNITTEAYPLAHITLNDSSLVLYMPFDVNQTYPANVTYDYSTNNNDGTVINGTLWNNSGGIIGGAYNFDGINDAINISDSNSLDMNQTITVMAWVYPYTISATSSQTRVISKTSAYELMLSTVTGSCDSGSGHIQWRLTRGGLSAELCSGSITLNTWTHIVGTFNGSTFAVYQDGVLKGTAVTNNSDIDMNSNPLFIGNHKDINRPFNGTIDEVMISNRTLSASEINDTFKNQSYRYRTPATQLFENISINQTGSFNRAEVTTNATLLFGTNISLRLREYNQTGANTANTSWQNISDGDNKVTTFNISNSTYNVTLEFDFIAWNGNQSGNFYSPVLRDNIIVTSFIGVSSCQVLSSANTTYTQTANIVPSGIITPCINITAQNITFNGNGFWISNRTLNVTGIYSNQRNTTIRNANITMNDTAGGIGIFFENTATYSSIINSTFRNNRNGIFIIGGAYDTIKDNIISESSNMGIETSSTSHENFINNTLEYNIVKGIYIVGGVNNTLENNTFNGNGIGSGAGANGLEIILTNANILRSNTFNNNSLSLRIHASENNSIINNVINASRGDAINFLMSGTSANYNNFTNVTITNTASGAYDIRFVEAGINGTYLIDMPNIGNYSFNQSIVYFKDSNFGEIRFLTGINGSGTNLTNDVRIRNNSVVVLSNVNVGLNRSANVTLYGMPGNFVNPEIARDGVACGNICYNFTSLNAATVIFNVSSWTNFSIRETPDTTYPAISFVAPTLANSSNINKNYVEINVSIIEQNLNEIKFNWNGTNYTIYNDSLILMMNFDNRSALGENSTFVADLSRYGNNGTCSGTNCPLWNSSGRYGGAFSFDGVNDYITMGDVDEIDNSNTEITILTWFKIDKLPTSAGTRKTIVGKYDTPSQREFWLLIGDSVASDWDAIDWNVQEEATVSSTSTRVLSVTNITTNTWYHVAAVFKGGTRMQIYVNGVLDAELTSGVPNDFNNTAEPLLIGAIETGTTNEFNGTIDEVIIFNRSLNATEIQQLYFSNLQKYNSTQWYLYINQSKNATARLDDATYTYFASAKDTAGNENVTDTRTVSVDITSPSINFTSPTPANGSTQTTTSIFVNVSTSDANEHYSFVDFDRSLLLWMRMDDVNSTGHPTDLSRYSNNGTLVGNASINSTGRFGNASWFDGDNDYIEIASSSSLNITREITVASWVRFNNATVRHDIVGKWGGSNPNRQYLLLMYAGGGGGQPQKIQFWVGDSSNNLYQTAVGSQLIQENTWYHIAGTYNGSELVFYLNGAREGNKTVGSFNLKASATKLLIGDIVDPDGNATNGTIDEVLIFNRSLTAKEIEALYNASNGRYTNNFTNLADSTHTFKAYAVDTSGNENETEQRSVTVDIASPQVSIVSPQNITYSTANYPPIYFNFSLNEAGGCNYSLNGGATNYTMTANASSTGFNASNSSIADGSYNVRAYCQDNFGNRNLTENIVFSLETTIPTITINQPANTYYNAGSVTFNVTLNENGNACNYTLNNGAINYTMGNLSDTRTWNATNSSIADGNYTVRFFCWDVYNNLNSSVNKTFVIDTTAPSIDSIVNPVVSPTAICSVNSIALDYIASDTNIDYCAYNVTYDNSTTIANTNISNCANTTFSVDANREYTLGLRIFDKAGNTGSRSRNFTVNTAASSCSSPAPSSGGGGGGGGAAGRRVNVTGAADYILFIDKMNDIIIRKGEKKVLAAKLINKGAKFLNNCKLKGGLNFEDWIESTDISGLAPGEIKDFIFKIKTPENITEKEYNVILTGICDENQTSKGFLATVITDKFEFRIKNIIDEGEYIRVLYSAAELSNNTHNVTINYWLEKNKDKIIEGSKTINLKELSTFDDEIVISKAELISGIYDFKIKGVSEYGQSLVAESLLVRKNPFTGIFALIRTLKGIIILGVLILMLVIIILIRLRKSWEKRMGMQKAFTLHGVIRVPKNELGKKDYQGR